MTKQEEGEEILKTLTGQHTCRSGPPVLISITLMARTYIVPLGKVSELWPVSPQYAFLSQRCEVFDHCLIGLDLACRRFTL